MKSSVKDLPAKDRRFLLRFCCSLRYLTADRYFVETSHAPFQSRREAAVNESEDGRATEAA